MRTPGLPATVALTLLLSGCTLVDAPGSAPTPESVTHTLDNCGVQVPVGEPVERAVALEQGASDTLLMLGAGGQIAGVGHQKDNPPEGTQTPPIISPTIPTAEQIRAADADFVYSPFAQVWTADAAGTREEWQRLGVRTYQSNTECRDYGDNAGQPAFSLIKKDIGELGELFGREDEANALAQRLDSAVAGANQAPDGTTFLLLYSTLGGAPYVAGGPSIPTEMGEAVNMTNVFAGVKEEWPQVSWEALAAADPDVIVLADLPVRGEPGDTWQEKAADLEANPATRNLRAVKERRYIIINGVTTSASARSYQGLEQWSDAVGSGIAG